MRVIFTHLKLWVAIARHNFKWVKTYIRERKGLFYNVLFDKFDFLGNQGSRMARKDLAISDPDMEMLCSYQDGFRQGLVSYRLIRQSQGLVSYRLIQSRSRSGELQID